MFKRVFPLLGASSSSILAFSMASCVELEKVNAITKDGSFSQAMLFVTGEGMRKKKILMLDLDIYNVKVSFSAPLLKEARSWKSKNSQDTTLHAVVFDKLIHTRNDDASGISVNLNFVRGVTTNQVVEAFNESFVGCDPSSTTLFKDTLRSSVGTAGVSAGDHIEFYWLNGGGLVISVKGQVRGTIFNKEIEKRLLEVYIDPSRTVSPTLCTSLLQNLSE